MIRNRVLPIAALLASLAAQPARAEGVVFRFTRAIYGDDKELKLSGPEGVGCSDDGRVVVADTGNGRLVVYTMSEGAPSTTPKEVKLAQLTYPTRVVLDAKGTTWVLDRKARRIARVTKENTFAGWLETKDPLVPVSFVVTPAGTIAAIDAKTRSIVEIGDDGATLRRVALPKGEFLDLWVDGQGTIFALEAVAAQVWTAQKGAELKPLTRSLKGEMSFPAQLTTNGRGRLFVVDQNGMGIVVLGLDGSYQGRQLAIGWLPGGLYYPSQLCVAGKGVATIADRGNNRVQVYTTIE